MRAGGRVAFDARICVIGAGPSGIAAAKELVQAGFGEVAVFERGHEVGGNWVFDDESGHSSVFETTHIISSKRYSQYDDFPMPADYPDYPSHELLAEYFQAYARHFDLYGRIRFGTTVHRCVPRSEGGWTVTVEDDDGARDEEFAILVVANGHHWKPRWPDIPGERAFELLHSHDFKRAEPFRDRRVLVIGGGNSACDVAVETARVARSVDISWRRGYWVVPKFLFGRPSDEIHESSHRWLGFIPLRWRLRGMQLLLRLLNGPNSRYGLPEPDHALGETHPAINSELLYFIRHGEIRPRPDVERFAGDRVRFVDGAEARYDAVIACTGFEIAHPFLDPNVLDLSSGPVPLYLKMIPEHRPDLYFIGLFQPLGSVWPMASLQARIMARRLAGAWRPPADLGAAIRREMATPDLRQLDTPRHTVEVDGPSFRDRLLAELAKPR